MMRKTLAVLALCASITLGAAATASAQMNQMNDAWITMKTKIALLTTEGIHPIGLNVDTVQGVVTLHGKVETDATRKKAEEVARGIDGAKAVKNLLQVVPPQQADRVEARDDDTESRVKDAFKANAMVASSGIGVASVNKGVVLLSGRTKSLEAHLRAVELAAQAKGVRRVSSEVVVEERRSS